MALPPNFLGSMTLKALLEDPNLKNPPIIQQQSSDIKIKKEGSGGTPQFNYGSAFLGPNLWDKTYNNSDFNLEYMDLDEFLSENEIPAVTDDALTEIALGNEPDTPQCVNVAPNTPPSPRQFLRTPPMSPSQFLTTTPSVPSPQAPPSVTIPPTASVYTQPFAQCLEHSGNKSPSPPVSPLHVDFHVSEQDLALTCVPDYSQSTYSSWGQQSWSSSGSETKHNHGVDFDPRKRNFTDEELKPQPIIKKSKKVFVPEDLKDEKYWARRQKNNFAAKRSRDARRVKENQIALRAAFLEKENKCLRDEMTKLKKENAQLKSRLSNYEPTEENTT